MTALQEIIHRGNSFSHLFSRLHNSVAHWVSRVNHAGWLERKEKRFFNSVPKACADRSGTDCVLHIIRESHNGTHPRTLAQMTGYRKPKLDRILHKLFKHGEIMIEAGGVYKSTEAFNTFRPV